MIDTDFFFCYRAWSYMMPFVMKRWSSDLWPFRPPTMESDMKLAILAYSSLRSIFIKILPNTLNRNMPLWCLMLCKLVFFGFGIITTFTVFIMSGTSNVSLVLFIMWRMDFLKSVQAASYVKSSLTYQCGCWHFLFFSIFKTSSSCFIVHGSLLICLARSNLFWRCLALLGGVRRC